MSVARVLSAAVASLGVAGCAVVALKMSAGTGQETAADRLPAAAPRSAASTSRPAFRPMHPAAGVGGAAVTTPARSTAAPVTTAATSVPRASTAGRAASTSPLPSSAQPPSSTPAATVRAHATTASRTSAPPRPAATTAALQRGSALPLRYSTGTATRVITVTSHSAGNTTATLQAWNKAPGGGWLRHGTATTAHIGADGMSTHPSETRSATPIGSYTLTLAFGHLADPGTRLPYIHTNPADWWISQAGPLYNTHQRCASGCAFTRGSPNEHLYYETPYYNYAVVIDYNTRNAPGGVRQGAGSAFFLHVTDGNPTAGCVAIGQPKLVSLMRWLAPSTHPRILIGVH